MNQAVPSPYPSPGEVIDGKYQIERVLGEGGMGMVARAYHMLLRAPVALKFMNPQFMTFPGAVERFINEGIASKRIRSDHVVPVDDVGKLATGAPYLVMPCLDGMDLADMLARDGTPGLPVERAIHFVVQILRGLQAAHAAGIIHRDMKPSNCFVVKHDGEGDFIRILDFGISKVVQPGSASLTQTNSALGTPLYMSPEQARSPRDVDGRSDIYSVGVILYELLTGHTPFFSESGEFTEILFKLFTADPPPVKSTRPDLDDGLAEVVHHALTREPVNRYATAKEFAEALAPYAGDHTKRILNRIRTFKESEAMSMPPPADMPLPSSMIAFSALDARPATDLMANRPTTDVMRGPPVTEVLVNQQANAPATQALATAKGTVQVAGAPRPAAGTPADASGGEGRSISASPPDMAARARPDEAGARTQYDSGKAPAIPGTTTSAMEGGGRMVAGAVAGQVTGASTDLGAARDATMPGEGGPKRSPLVFALAAAALMAVGAAGVFAASQKPSGKGTATATATETSTAKGIASETPLPSASIGLNGTGATSASALTAPPPVVDAGVTATRDAGSSISTASGGSSGAGGSSGGAAKRPPGPSTRPNVLDTDIKQ